MLPSVRGKRGESKAASGKQRQRLLLAMLAVLVCVGYTLNYTFFGSSISSRHEQITEPNLHEIAVVLEEEELDEKTRKQCYEDRDYGMIEKLRGSQRNLCDNATGVDPELGPLSTYSYFYTPGSDIRGTVVRNLWIDLRQAQVHKPIKSLAQDGGGHDPRLKYSSVGVHCTCASDQNQNTTKIPRVWEWFFGAHPEGKTTWRFCDAFTSKQEQETLAYGYTPHAWDQAVVLNHKKEHANDGVQLTAPHSNGWPYKIHHVKTNAIIMGRRDDHNPFFMIGAAMHSWIMMKVLGWTPETTQLLYLDDAIPTATDELQRRMLAPVLPVVTGREILGSVLRFDQALVAPFEFWGPLMRNLGSNEPCRRNEMIQDFRNEVMDNFKVSREKKDPRSCTITIISRRPYKGRMVQRKWLNEDAVVDRMVEDYVDNAAFYKYGTCKIQSLEFVDLTLEQQMHVIVESDVIIGMHGAGMVNLMWTRPGTAVVEIFPKNRYRWGYKNLCFFVGCKWHEFRKGEDTGVGDNSSDKRIPYSEWFPFFDPIIRAAVRALEARVANTTSW